MRRAVLVVLVVLVVLFSALTAPATAMPVVVTPPVVTGAATYGETLTAQPGTWDPPATGYGYQWLREGTPVPGATAPTYVLGLADLDHTLAVQVMAVAADGTSATATSAPSAPVARAVLGVLRPSRITGTPRFGRTVRATAPRFVVDPGRLRYRWLRGGTAIDGATGDTYALQPADVGAKVRVEVTASVPGYTDAVATSAAVEGDHRRGVRRTVTYHVETRGQITTSVREFARLAQQTYDDPRGWRGAGIRFQRVQRGGAFTLVLAAAAEVPRFSGSCSATYSCRVGRFVIVNQDRWLHATPPWNAAGGSLRDYRHLVVDHETGHWLGLGHSGCPRAGAPAPVMMQQSKGLDGCRFNSFPTLSELARVS